MTAYVCLDLRCPYQWIQIKKLQRLKELISRGDCKGLSICYQVERKGDVRELFEFMKDSIAKEFYPPVLFHVHEQNHKKMLNIVHASVYIVRKTKKVNKNYRKQTTRVLSWYNFAQTDGGPNQKSSER